MYGENYLHHGSNPHFTGYFDSAAVSLDELFGDSESQTGSSGIGGSRLFNAIESLEYSGQVLFGNTQTVVDDLDGNLFTGQE